MDHDTGCRLAVSQTSPEKTSPRARPTRSRSGSSLPLTVTLRGRGSATRHCSVASDEKARCGPRA
eukprot:518745-Rhodomonas_salina.12